MFLKKTVFRQYPKGISAVGFKIFYDHAQSDSRKIIWHYLKDQKNLKIIHLKRDNLLRRFLSLKKATLTDEWVRHTPNVDMKEIKMTLSYEECLQNFIEVQNGQEKYDAYFKDHAKIDIIYENLSHDPPKEMKRIQEFLNIDVEPLQILTYKQSFQPLSASILNYSELKERFQRTPWESFFED